jgi:hypothetical protein
MMYATRIIADDTFHVFMLIAAILFVIGAVMSVMERAWTSALLLAGLTFVAVAYVVVS